MTSQCLQLPHSERPFCPLHCLHCRAMHLRTLCITSLAPSVVHHDTCTSVSSMQYCTMLPLHCERVPFLSHHLDIQLKLQLQFCCQRNLISLREEVCIMFSVDHIFLKKCFGCGCRTCPVRISQRPKHTV